MRRPPRPVRPLLLLAALPVLMAPGKCGFIVDFTETILIPDDATKLALNTEDGDVVATSYDRQGVLLKRHTRAYEPSIGDVEWFVEDDVVHLEAHCKYEGNCSFDHMLEVPLDLDFEATMKTARIRLGYWGGDIAATFESGLFQGVRLESANVRVELGDGDVILDHALAPASVTVELGEGTALLSVPPGAYKCDLDAGGAVDIAAEVTCDDAATAVLSVTVKTGDIAVKGADA